MIFEFRKKKMNAHLLEAYDLKQGMTITIFILIINENEIIGLVCNPYNLKTRSPCTTLQ